jgi:hypothetical protein
VTVGSSSPAREETALVIGVGTIVAIIIIIILLRVLGVI